MFPGEKKNIWSYTEETQTKEAASQVSVQSSVTRFFLEYSLTKKWRG